MPRETTMPGRDWFNTQVATWLDLMHEKGNPMLRPMLLMQDTKGKTYASMIMIPNGYMHDFVKNIPGLIENAKKNGTEFSNMVYYFHTGYVQTGGYKDATLDASDGCKEKSRVHFVGFSSKRDGIIDHAHADVCVLKEPGKNGGDVDVWEVAR